MTRLNIVLVFDTDDAEEGTPGEAEVQEFAAQLNLDVAASADLGYQGWYVEAGPE